MIMYVLCASTQHKGCRYIHTYMKQLLGLKSIIILTVHKLNRWVTVYVYVCVVCVCVCVCARVCVYVCPHNYVCVRAYTYIPEQFGTQRFSSILDAGR